ncbi:hypothetical protein [Agrobacterium sp. CG674]
MDRVTTLKQELFNEIVAKAALQNFEQSFADDEQKTCAYRGNGPYAGRCCNVGHLIPDAKYDAGFEGNPIEFHIFERTTAYETCIARGFDRADQDEIHQFLLGLQSAHDESGNGAEHKHRLTNVAVAECLTIPDTLA